MHHSDTDKAIIDYTYKGRARTAEVRIVSSAGRSPIFWFYWPKGPPHYIGKENGIWFYGGTRPLTVDCPKGEILLILAAAIDEQLLKF